MIKLAKGPPTCRDCKTILMWKKPYKKGDRPVGLNGKPHDCPKRKGMVDRGDYSRFNHERTNKNYKNLPDISQPDRPRIYHCLKCNIGTEVIKGPIETCIPCQKQGYKECQEYCPYCKLHPTSIYCVSEKGAIWEGFNTDQVNKLIYDPVSEAKMREVTFTG